MRARKLLRKVALSLAVAVALLVGLELTLRALGYAETPAIYYDPEIGLRYYPNQVRTVKSGDQVTSQFRTNSWGLRGADFEEAKAPGVRRVVCLGDSFTLGWGVGDDETWPRQLQVHLDGQLGPGQVEVINLGQPDFNTVNEQRMFERIGRRLSPDIVVLAFVLNDLAPETLGPVNMTSRLEHAVGSTATMAFLRRYLFPHMGVYQYAHTSLNRERRAAYATLGGSVVMQPDAEASRPFWEVSMEALRGIDASVSACGARLLVVSFPGRYQIASTLEDPAKREELSAPQRKLGSEVSGMKADFLNLFDTFLAVGLPAYHPLDNDHPSPEGQKAAAAAIGAALIGWLQDAPADTQGAAPGK